MARGEAKIEAENERRRKAQERQLDSEADRRYRCYMWFSRMGCPNQKEMKRRVANLPAANNDITVEDVDLLPWMPGGFTLNIREMNKLFVDPERLK